MKWGGPDRDLAAAQLAVSKEEQNKSRPIWPPLSVLARAILSMAGKLNDWSYKLGRSSSRYKAPRDSQFGRW